MEGVKGKKGGKEKRMREGGQMRHIHERHRQYIERGRG